MSASLVITIAIDGALIAAGFWLMLQMQQGKDLFSEEAWGDHPAIPEEAKARGGKSLGERAEKAARAQRRTSEGYRTARHRERL